MLSRLRDDLAREERRIEKLIAMSEEMANRFRLALNLMSSSIEQFMGDLSGQAMMTAALRIAEQEAFRSPGICTTGSPSASPPRVS